MDIVKFLQEYTIKKDICTTSGAFVFEDPNHKLFYKLYNSNKYPRISSHNKHFKTNSHIQGYGLDIPDFEFKCGNKSVVKKTILFFKYVLQNPKTGNLKHFTYVKLETYGMKKLSDIIGHSIQYLKTRFYSDKNLSKRTEHTKLKTDSYVYKTPELAKNICKMIPECKSKKQLEYTQYYRRGFEIFVPKYDFGKKLLKKG